MESETQETAERRATTVRLPVAQLRWLNAQAFERKTSQQAIMQIAISELMAADHRGDPIDWNRASAA